MRDLPVPDWLFFWGGAVVLVLSFLALGALWKTPQLERRRAGHPLPAGLERFLRSPRPARDSRRDLGRPARPHLPDRAHRRAVVGAEPLTDLHLRDLLARARAAAGACSGTSGRVLNPWLALANGVEWIWRKLGQEWKPPLEYPERLGALAGGVLPPLLCGTRALLRGAGQPAGAGARDRALQLRDVVRHGRLRAARVGLARERLLRLLRPARADRAIRRARGPARPADAVLRSLGPRDDVGRAGVRRRDARLGRLRRLQPLIDLAGPPRP